MSVLFGDHIDVAQKELRNPVAQSLVADPASPVAGQFWWRSDLQKFRVYDGTAVQSLRTAAAITSADIQDGTIVNADIATGAAISYAKLSLGGSIVNADLSPTAAIAYSKLALANSIVNGDIATAAGIAYSKLALGNSVVNADIATGAAIVYSKLALSSSIVNGDISASAAIAYSKLNLAGSIVNADIAAAAGIALSKLATDPLARANHTGTQLASTISNFDTQVRTSRLDQMAVPTASVNMNGQDLAGLPSTPLTANSAVSKSYADSLKAGLDTKDSVRLATTAPLPAHTNATNVKTASANGLLIVDGTTVQTGDRILVKDETTAQQYQGIYTVTNPGSAGAAWVLTRATDADASAEVTGGMYVFVTSGPGNADTGWVLTTDDPITLNTTALSFTQYTGAGAINAGDGLTKSGNTLSVLADPDFTIGVASTGVYVAYGKLTDAHFLPANVDGIAANPSLRTLGRGAQQALPGSAVPLATSAGQVPVALADGTFQWQLAPALGSAAPVGTMWEWPGDQAPIGTLMCDGAAVSRATYPDLFAAITIPVSGNTTNATATISNVSAGTISRLNAAGVPTSGTNNIFPISGPGIPAGTFVRNATGTTISLSANATATATAATLAVCPWGIGDGSTTFNLPDMRSRSPLGAGQGAGLSTRRLADFGGEEVHVLTTGEMPSHTHTASQTAHTHGFAGGATVLNAGGGYNAFTPGSGVSVGTTTQTDSQSPGVTVNAQGGGASHNVMSPWRGLNYIIQAVKAAAGGGGGGSTNKFAQAFGDASATVYTITHSLASTDVFGILVRRVSDGQEVKCGVRVVDANNLEIQTGSPPGVNAYRVVVAA